MANKQKKVAKKADALVTNIVSVDSTPNSTGVSKMAKTAEKAKDFTADLGSKATAAVEKSKDLAAKGFEFQKSNAEAFVASGKIGFAGAKEFGKTNVEFAKANFAEAKAVTTKLSSIKTPADLMKLQGDYAKKTVETAATQASKNTEAFVKLFGDMFQPISERVAATTEIVKKVA